MKSIKWNGKTYTGDSFKELSVKSGVSIANVKKLIRLSDPDNFKFILDNPIKGKQITTVSKTKKEAINDILNVITNPLSKNTKLIKKNKALIKKNIHKITNTTFNAPSMYLDVYGNTFKLDVTKNNKNFLLKEFKIKDDAKLEYKQISPNIKITNRNAKIQTVDLIIELHMFIQISDIVYRITTFNYNGPNDQGKIEDEINDHLDYYLKPFGYDHISNEINYIPYIVGSRNKVLYRFENQQVRESQPLKIFNESLTHFIPKDNENCVYGYINKIHPRVSKGTRSTLNNIEGVTVEELKNYCVNVNVKFKAYDITGLLRSSYTPLKRNKNLKKVCVVIYNNHIYPINNKYLHKDDKPNKNVIIVDDIETELVKMLKNGYLPCGVDTFGTSNIMSFQDDKNVYIKNKEYLACQEIADKLGIKEKIPYYATLANLSNFIEPLYSSIDGEHINTKSLWLNSNDFIKGGYNYHTNKQVDKDQVVTIDKKLCYTSILRDLPYLITLDYKFDYIVNDDIVDHYLYICEPEKSNLLMPNTNVYSGEFVSYCKNIGLKFKIKEGITTTKHDNYFKQMIDDLYKIDKMNTKNIINPMIGRMEKGVTNGNFCRLKFNRICTTEEMESIDGYISEKGLEIDDYTVMFDKIDKQPSIFTRKPISFQVKDKSRLLLFETILKLNIKAERIVKIKTDSISFISNNPIKVKDEKGKIVNGDDICKNLIGSGLNHWKYETYTEMTPGSYINNDLSFKTSIYTNDQQCQLITGDAGNGKTYNIINKLIVNMKDYIVLTPSHATLKQYRENKINNSIIHTYIFNNTIPEEKNIIIDEVGMCDYSMFNLFVKCIYAGKNIYCYGDFTQLLPVNCDKQLDNELLINAMFNKITTLDGNHRNNFTKEYYNKLRTGNKQYIINEVKKHNVPWDEAEYIICFYNDTRKYYNKLVMDKLGHDSILSKGCRVICKTNDLREKNIFNNFIFTVNDILDEIVIIDDISISINDFKKYFEPAYALTLYCIQGDSCKSFHYPLEYKTRNGQSESIRLDNRCAYTLISRLKI